MINENSTYYYKQVEEAFANIHRAFQEILKDVNVDLISTEFAVLSVFPEKIQWSKHESVAGLNLKEEELSEEQKEEIALSGKDYFDEVISSFNPLVYFNKFSQDYNRCLTRLTAIIMEAVETYASINKNTISSEENGSLPLTHEELYYAFSFLNKDQVREVLYGQQQIVFDKLYNTILEKDISGFKNALDVHPINQMPSLKYYLIEQVNSIFPFGDFIKSPELINSSFLEMILEESGMPDDIIEYFDAFKKSHLLDPKNGIALNDFGSIDFGNLIDFQIQNLIGIHKLFFYSMDVPRFYRKRLLENYNEWRKEYPDAPDINIAAEIDIDVESSMNITNVLTDKWLIDAIHKRMEEANADSSCDDNLRIAYTSDIVENNKTNRSQRFVFPNRIKVYSNHYNAILTEIYKYYGGSFEDMSCEDFIYLFGGTGKMPKSYAPPFYFMNDDARLKALIRILYVRQPRKFGNIILHISDKATGAIYHDWGVNKKGASYIDDEKLIQSIVSSIAGVKMESL